MALSNNLIVRIAETSRDGAISIRFKVFSADNTTELYHGAIKYGDIEEFKKSLIDDKEDIIEALETVLRSCIGSNRQANALEFDSLAGKTFRVQSRAVEIIP